MSEAEHAVAPIGPVLSGSTASVASVGALIVAACMVGSRGVLHKCGRQRDASKKLLRASRLSSACRVV